MCNLKFTQKSFYGDEDLVDLPLQAALSWVIRRRLGSSCSLSGPHILFIRKRRSNELDYRSRWEGRRCGRQNCSLQKDFNLQLRPRDLRPITRTFSVLMMMLCYTKCNVFLSILQSYSKYLLKYYTCVYLWVFKKKYVHFKLLKI